MDVDSPFSAVHGVCTTMPPRLRVMHIMCVCERERVTKWMMQTDVCLEECSHHFDAEY